MKKKTKKILAIVAVIIVLAGFVAYEVGSLFLPLKYNNDYIAQKTIISDQEREKLLDMYNAFNQANQNGTDTDVTLTCKESYTLENLVLPEGLSREDIPESTFEIFGLKNETNETTYNKGDYITEFFDFIFSLNDISSGDVKENKNGSKEYTLTLPDEMCYFTGLYIYKVVPYIAASFDNLRLYGFHGPAIEDIKDLTSVIVRDADILFPGTTIKIIIDKNGHILHITTEIPVKCEARVISGLFSRDTATIEFTKTVSYDFEYKV